MAVGTWWGYFCRTNPTEVIVTLSCALPRAGRLVDARIINYKLFLGNSMSKIVKGLAIAGMSLALPLSAFAATNLTFLTVDGLANTSVNVGDSINAKVTYAITSNDDVESLDWELVGSGLPPQCVDIADQINTGTFHPQFEMNTDGATGGTFDVKVRLYGVNGSGVDQTCGDGPNDTMTFTNRISIAEDGNDTGIGSGTGNTGNGSGTVSQMDKLIALITAMLHPTTPAPTTNSVCTEYASLSSGLSYGSDTRQGGRVGQLQSFLMYKGFNIPLLSSNQAPYGFYGSQTSSAASGFVAANHCI